jgi:WD40 repeat protein
MDSTIATTPCCGDIRLYDFATGKLMALLKGHTAVVNGLAFSPDSKRLISGGGLGDLSAIRYGVPAKQVPTCIWIFSGETEAVSLRLVLRKPRPDSILYRHQQPLSAKQPSSVG